VPEVRLLPAREFPMDDGGRTQFRGRWRELFEGDPSKRRLYKDVFQRRASRRRRVLPAAVLRPARDRLRLLPAARR
jgi:transcription-repair coupling factor (superfamily II helicase)